MSIWTRIADALSALTSGEPLSIVFDRLRTPPERSVAFAIAVIGLGAKMAKADGQVTRNEVTAFREVFLIPESEEANAARVFNLARQDVAGFEDYARRIARMFGQGDPALCDLMEGLFHIAVADGRYHPAEDDFPRPRRGDIRDRRAALPRPARPLRARRAARSVAGPGDRARNAARGGAGGLAGAGARKSPRPDDRPRRARGGRQDRRDAARRDQPGLGGDQREGGMRIATYNVEWFTTLFDDAGALLEDEGPSGRAGVPRHEQLAALGVVFTALDADGVMVIEAPDAHRRRDGARALETFAATYGLRARKALLGFVNETQQEIAFLHDPDVLTVSHDPRGEQAPSRCSEGAPRFDGALRIDLDIDGTPDIVRWSKPPLELALRTASGFDCRVIGVHMKSKAPHGARNPAAVMRIAIENRRKQLAQGVWLRRRIEEHLAAGEPLIVLGDFNDGPGLDEYEKLFGRSSLEIVMGREGEVQLHDPAARLATLSLTGAAPTSARFWMPAEERWMETLIDYIMVSPDLRARARRWRIWHPFDDPGCYRVPELREALLSASDHFPVTLDIDV
jgi:uncharacterized tellurite resistance protein B-like protein